MFFASKQKISPVFRYEHEKVANAMRSLFELDSNHINQAVAILEAAK